MTFPRTPALATRLEQGVLRRWYGSPGLLWLLWPLEWLYRAVVSYKRFSFLKGWRSTRRARVPVIVVGNITVGGTGKTPVTLALCRALQVAGFKPGIASRGYGSLATQFPLAVTADTPVTDSGDEPLLLARRSGVPVAIDPDRAEAVALLESEFGCNVVICDDGLQHYAMARDIEWVVVDGRRGFGNRRCLPLGPLREPLSRLDDVAAVLLNGGDEDLFAGAVRFALRPTQVVPIHGGAALAPADFAAIQPRVHAVAGIGHPQRFFDTLRELGLDVVEHPFPDHHIFTPADLAFGDDLPVVMTEKDAVKCAPMAGSAQRWFLAVEAELPAALLQATIERVAALKRC